MTGKLGVPLPERWNEIPGTKGCATIYEANPFIINYRGMSLHKKVICLQSDKIFHLAKFALTHSTPQLIQALINTS